MSSDDARLSRLVGWAIVCLLVAGEWYRRAVGGVVPPDFSAYLAAADVWMAGGDPYGTALLEAERYEGYPFVYAPGTLPIVAPLAALPTTWATSMELLARVAVLLGIGYWCRETWELDPPLFALVPLAFFYEPLVADFLGGNLTTYMLGAVLLCREIGGRDGANWHVAVGLPIGVALAFKPMWALPAGTIVVLSRARRLGAGLALGGTAVVGATVWQWGLVDDWLRRIEQVRRHYQSIDLLSLGRWLQSHDLLAGLPPALFPAAGLLLWTGAGLHLARLRWGGGNEASGRAEIEGGIETPELGLWLWSCVSLVAWPRLGSYSYVLLVPLLCALWRALGSRRTVLIALPAFGPLPWMLRLIRNGLYHRMLLYLWGLGLTVWLFVRLSRRDGET
jgi:hypothetical protein